MCLFQLSGMCRLRCIVQTVCPESKECKSVLALVQQTLPQAQLVQLQRIQKLWLWEKYYHCQDRMFLKNPESAAKKDLFHGTSTVPPAQLYQSEYGFDFRLSSRKAKWGSGSYFSSCAKYSNKYAHRIPDTMHKQLLLANVLTGQSCMWPQDRTLSRPPPKPAISGSLRLYNECYDSAYPAYILTYYTT